MTLPYRPMKAPTDPVSDSYLEQLQYPLVASPKIDGIRLLNGGKLGAFTSQLKPIKNKYVQKCLSFDCYEGLDSEIVVGNPFIDPNDDEDDVFHRTSGPIRRAEGEPAFNIFVFDDFTFRSKDYKWRWLDQMRELKEADLPFVKIIEQRMLYSPQEVIDFEIECIELGYEGCMPRRISAPYKEGRATLREEFIFKRKPIEIDDGIIVGYYEQLENCNEQTVNELGTHSRSAHKENKYPKGTLGGYILKSDMWKETFKCGTIIGSTLASRKEMWDNREKSLGQIVSYKFQRIGSIDKPRQPRIKGFREDVTNW